MSHFSISDGRQDDPVPGSLVLTAAGLGFALAGLSPATPAPLATIVHWYGLPETSGAALGEAVTLIPDNNWAGGNPLPMVRVMAGVASDLAQLAQAKAVVWQPARTAMAPRAFTTAIGDWLRGGAFPALGLTALFTGDDGAIRSEGLAFFTGQELIIAPSLSNTTAQDAKIAARLINHLVGSEAIHQPLEFLGPNGEHLAVEPPDDNGFLRVCRKS